MYDSVHREARPVAKGEIFENENGGPNKWERISLPPKGHAPIRKLTLSKGLEIDNLRFTMDVHKQIENMLQTNEDDVSKLVDDLHRILPRLFHRDQKLIEIKDKDNLQLNDLRIILDKLD